MEDQPLKASLTKRLEELEAAAGLLPKTHLVWAKAEGDDISDAVAEMLASGRAKPGDLFRPVSWLGADVTDGCSGMAVRAARVQQPAIPVIGCL